MRDLFKTPEGKKEILDLYDQKLLSLDMDTDSLWIDTAFGKTHILAVGEPTAPPLVVLHGSNGCAPIALETYPNLLHHFRVYAIDVPGQPNKSTGPRLSMKDNSHGLWIHAVIEKLDLRDVILAGFSLGGLIILQSLLVGEGRIKEVFLAAPAFIVNGNPFKSLLKIFLPMRRFMKSGDPVYIEKFLDVLFTERDDFAIKYLSMVFRHFEMDFTPVPVIDRKGAESIQTPITLFAARNDMLFPGEKMIKRANRIFPSLKRAIQLSDSKHVQNRHDNDLIEKIIIDG